MHVTVSDDETSVTRTLTVTVGAAARQTLAATRTVAAGHSVSLTGAGYRAGERVSVALAAPRPVTRAVTADGRGRIATSVTVPAGTAAGHYAVTATGARTKTPATAVVAVPDARAASAPQVRSTLVLSSTTAMPGERITAQGAGYRPNRTVTLTATTASGSRVRLAGVRANGDGVFTTTFVMPAAAGGLRSVTTSDAATAGDPPASSPLTTVRTPHGTRR